MNAPRSQRGQVLVIFALFLIVLLGATALAVDYGSWLKVRRDYQNVVDAATLAGSGFLTRPIDNSKRELAREATWDSIIGQLGLTGLDVTALKQSDTPAGAPVQANGYRVWVSTPPIGSAAKYPGAYTSSSSRTLFAWIERDNPSYFARIMGIGDKNISAWATSGVFPNRFAVITLREQGQSGPSDAEDIFLGGTNSGLEVVEGDVGGNWGMKLNSDSHLWLRGNGTNDAEAYLINYIRCGPQCWNVGQVSSGPNGNPPNEWKDPLPLPGPVEDPDYRLPAAIASAPASAQPPAIPIGDLGGDVDVRSGGPDDAPGGTSVDGTGKLRCDPQSPRIGPGYYTSIQVRGGKCLILDPLIRHSSVSAAIADVPAALPNGQMPGIFYVNGPIDVGNAAMIVGDGVTLIMRPHPTNENLNQLEVVAGGVVSLNRGEVTANRQRGAWTIQGISTYTCDGSWNCSYDTALNNQIDQVGVALYVIKRQQFMSTSIDNNTDVVRINAGAALSWAGVTYAARDNIQLSGQPGHDGIGQFVSWTFKFVGGTNVRQIYDGPDLSTPRLLEPTLGQ